jgi:hypothetical protein
MTLRRVLLMSGSSTLRPSRRRRAVATLVATMALALAVAPIGALGSEPTVITMWSDTTWDVSDADTAAGRGRSTALARAGWASTSARSTSPDGEFVAGS